MAISRKRLPSPSGATAGLPSSVSLGIAPEPGVLRTPYWNRPGFTLVELLVTLVIIMMLTAIAVPVLAPALAGRRQREASREVTSYFALARDTAMRTGRATGVMLERFTGAGNASAKALIAAGLPPTPVPEMCLTLWQVEVPPPYSGDTLYSRAFVLGGFGVGQIAAIVTPGSSVPEAYGLVRIGDTIKFNTQGHLYQIIGGTPDTTISPNPTGLLAPPTPGAPWTIMPIGGTTAFVPSFALGVPYQIMRQPVKTSAPPLQLPEGIVVDLAASGMTPQWTGSVPPYAGFNPANVAFTASFCPLDATGAPQFPSDSIPIIVLFSPTGSVERMAFSGPNPSNASQPMPFAVPPTTPIFLLLGQREKVPAASNVNNENWRDATNLWITIFPQTGLVTSTENVPLNPPSGQPFATPGGYAGDLMAARRLALEGQTLGGR
ncbi:MAG: prepilin-type N-terminal cleavage/methylation domain-containing protein [Pirellulales bacterium]|nr:prepilin-type N-terminal cleavage/methylation domain-containing protein [Pirellulales bacterium]